MALIFPSLISADLLNLEKALKTLDPLCPGYHLDVMDYHFVPNLTWGPAFLHAIAAKTSRQLWVHLMVDNPETWVSNLSLPTHSIITFHQEAIQPNSPIIDHIHAKNWLASIAINPETSIAAIIPFARYVDQILIMSVHPGQSGQLFIEDTISKAEELTAYKKKHRLNFSLAMDGGINSQNIDRVIAAGVTHCAVAQGIFGNPDPVQSLTELIKRVQ